MSTTNPDLQPDTISISALRKCLGLYPQVVERVYTAKIKDSKKLRIALDNDKWRFEELPRSFKDTRITKEQLERLVQWKITHGQNRPFLPSMIRKNDPEQVLSITSAAYSTLSALLGSSSTISSGTKKLETVRSALSQACVLTGVGPATGTLILSIFSPEHVPFFQDEMYAWFFPDAKKLKYDRKEYEALFKAVEKLRERLGQDIRAVEVEKVGYVLGHLDVLSEEELTGLVGGREDVEQGKREVEIEGQTGKGKEEEEVETEKSLKQKTVNAGTKRVKKSEEKSESRDEERRQSKRRKV